MKRFYSIIFALLLVTVLVNAQDQQYRQNGNLHTILEPRYWNGTTSIPANNTITNTAYLTYEYSSVNPAYQAYFDNNPNIGNPVLFISNGTSIDFAPQALNWVNNLSQIQPVAIVQSVQGVVVGNTFVYPAVYGAGMNLTYAVQYGRMKENLVIANRSNLVNPTVAQLNPGNVRLELGFQMRLDSSVNVIINGTAWDKSSDVSTNDEVLIKDGTGKTVYRMIKPIAKDAIGSTINLTYTFKKQGNKLLVYLYTPFTWLNSTSRVYPVQIDPTLVVLNEFNVTMIIAPENETCSGLECHSDIIFQNDGADNITINTSTIQVQIQGSNSSYLKFWDETTQSDLLTADGYNVTIPPNGTFQIDIYSNQLDYGTWKYNVTFLYNNYTYKIDPYYISVVVEGQLTTTVTTDTVVVNTLNLTIEPYNLLYAILWTAQTSSASGTASAYYDLLIDGTNYSSQLIEAKDVVAANFYVTTGALWVGNFTQGIYPISVRHRSGQAATISRIRNNYITALELPYNSNYLQSRAGVNFGASNARLQGTNINVTKAQPYWIFGSSIADNDGTINTQLRIDDVADSNSTWLPKDTRDYNIFMAQDVVNLTTGIHNMSIWGSSSITGAEMRDFNLVAVPLDGMYYFYNDSNDQSSTTSASNVQKVRLDFTLNSSTNGTWLIIGAAQTAESVNTASVIVEMMVDGVSKCNVTREPNVATTDWYPVVCQSSGYLASGNHNVTMNFRTSVGVSTTAYIRQADIIAFYSTAEKPCNPRYNRDWLISDAQVCDNVVREIGVGRINLTSTGSLDMRNGANITGTRVPPFLHNVTAPWKILIQRLSKLTLTREYWRSTNFQRRKQISITNPGSAALIDFPAYIKVTKESSMQANFSDIRFLSDRCDSPAGTVLSYEIENYTTTNALVWVKIPYLAPGVKQICMYYDNPGAASGQDPTGVWTANYTMVQHFEEPSGTIYDSTASGNNGTNNGSTYGVSGIVGTANYFDGANARVTLPFSPSIDLSRIPAFTIEAWVNTTALAGTEYPTIFAQGTWRVSLGLSDTSAGTDGRIESWINNANGAGGLTATTNGVWSYVSLGMDTTGRYFYFNGTPDDTGSYANPTDANEAFGIGNVFASDPIAGLNGRIDELRISNVRRSVDWLNETYQLIANQNTFVTFGSEETQLSIK